MTLLLLLAFVAAATAAAVSRGPWLDEFWSYWLSQAGVPFAEIASQRWMADFHPPLYSAAHWLVSDWLGDSVVARRLLNLVPLGWAVLFAWLAIRRFPRAAGFVLTYAVLALSLSSTTHYFAEMRSYFGQMCVFYALVTGTVIACGHDDALRWRSQPAFLAAFATTCLLALNIHYIASLLGSALLSLAVLWLWFGSRRRAAGVLLTVLLLSLLPAVIVFLLQRQFLVSGADDYWVTGGVGTGLVALLRVAKTAALANPVAWLALPVVALTLWAIARKAPPATEGSPARPGLLRRLDGYALTGERRRAATLVVAALLVFGVLLLIAHSRQPLITGRYLVAYQTVLAGLVAIMLADLVSTRRWLFAVLVGAALLQIVMSTRQVGSERNWDASSAAVAALVGRCPSSAVYVAEFPHPLATANATAVRLLGHRWEARRHGFAVEPYDNAKPPAAGGACPVLLWSEHVRWRALPSQPSAEAAMRVLGLGGSWVDWRRAEFHAAGTGFVLVLPHRCEGVCEDRLVAAPQPSAPLPSAQR